MFYKNFKSFYKTITIYFQKKNSFFLSDAEHDVYIEPNPVDRNAQSKFIKFNPTLLNYPTNVFVCHKFLNSKDRKMLFNFKFDTVMFTKYNLHCL